MQMCSLSQFIRLTPLLFALLFAACGEKDNSADIEPRTAPFPTVSWAEASPQELGMDTSRLMDLERFFSFQLTTSLLVVRKGFLVWERYGGTTERDTQIEVHSVAKSITSAAIGIGASEGFFEPTQSAATFIDPWKPPDPRGAITIDHLLTMTSGLGWSLNEYIYIYLSRLGFIEDDLLARGIEQPLEHEPGTHWCYNNLASMVLGRIISASTGMELRDFAQEKLFAPIGMDSVTWLTDAHGHTLSFMGLYATARDLARFGYLYLNRGTWDGVEIVPADWVDTTTRTHSDLNPAYGRHWWVNGYAESWDHMDGQPDFHLPECGYYFGDIASPGTYAALGAQGQMIVIVADLDLVMVRTGSSEFFDFAEAVTRLCRCVVDREG